MPIPVLYFHGFASSPKSAKIGLLRPILEPDGIELITPDLNIPQFETLDFDAMVAEGLRFAEEHAPRALVGSSLGALVALSVAKGGFPLPLVLIAPALGVARRWSEKIPDTDPVLVFNYARAEQVPIHKRFFEQMAALHVDDEPPPSKVIALIGRKDETVPFDIVDETWKSWEQAGLAEGSRFVELEEGDHSLIGEAVTIATAIREVAL